MSYTPTANLPEHDHKAELIALPCLEMLQGEYEDVKNVITITV